MSDDFDNRLKIHRLYFEARQQETAYFEKLALLNGATVSLIITAALSKFSAAFPHKYILGVALTSLVLAMVALLYGNFLTPRIEFHEAKLTVWEATEGKERKAKGRVHKRIYYARFVGVTLSALGVLLLLVEVWLVVTRS
jgi:hypothetical protein